MALSQQDLFVKLLLGDKGFYVDIGAGNGEGEPCASNTAWLEELGWTGLLLDYNSNLIEEARRFRPRSFTVCADAFKTNYKGLFRQCDAPKMIDYLSIDIDPVFSPTEPIHDPCSKALSLFPFDEYDFKILTIEHDFYNPHGPYQKQMLQNYMKDRPYKLIVEDVALSFAGTKYLEDWYINPKCYSEFLIKDIENLYYYRKNPNDIIIDLSTRRK